MNDLVVKAKQIDYLIQSLPEPEPEELQVCGVVTQTLRRLMCMSRPIGWKTWRTK